MNYKEVTFDIKCSDLAKADILFDIASSLYVGNPINVINNPLPMQQGNNVYGQIRFYDDGLKLTSLITAFEDCAKSKLATPYFAYHDCMKEADKLDCGIPCINEIILYGGDL